MNGSLPAGGGAGKLDVEGPGKVVLAADNKYVGGTLLNGGSLEVATQTAAGSGSISFGGIASLRLDTATFTNLIQGFTFGDTIDLAAIAPANVTVNQNGANTSVGGIQLLGTYAVGGTSGLVFSPDSGTGTLVTLACFAAGTRIATVHGDVPVERLCIGDRVHAQFGGTMPVVWLGRRRVNCQRHPRPTEVWPVRVRAGAFGDAVPRRDLLLSPNHAVYVDGVLVPVRYLINDVSIMQQEVETITYWHVELSAHDVLLAEGLPAESFLDTGGKADFENNQSEIRLHPDFLAFKREAKSCAPLVVTGSRLAAVRRQLGERMRRFGRSVPLSADAGRVGSLAKDAFSRKPTVAVSSKPGSTSPRL